MLLREVPGGERWLVGVWGKVLEREWGITSSGEAFESWYDEVEGVSSQTTQVKDICD